jgi:N-formylglutamate deformylase
LTDDELIEGFEAASLASFHHRDHVRVAWIYLWRLGLYGALGAVSRGLRRLAAVHGQSAKYHETVSWLYVFVIHERMAAGHESKWKEFEGANPDLLGSWGAFVARFYKPRTLSSPLARRSFVLPDRLERAGEGPGAQEE